MVFFFFLLQNFKLYFYKEPYRTRPDAVDDFDVRNVEFSGEPEGKGEKVNDDCIRHLDQGRGFHGRVSGRSRWRMLTVKRR